MDSGGQDALKKAAAFRAADFVRDGMAVGLGTGSTARFAALEIASRLREGRIRDIACVPTSEQTRALVVSLGLTLTTLDDHPVLDVAIDGADEVDTNLDLVKGAGGALLREKIVASAAREFIVVVDESKLVPRLGEKAPIPVEVVKFGWKTHLPALEGLGSQPELRMAASGEPFETDEGNVILDTRFPDIRDATGLARAIRSRAGVVEVGLFLGMAAVVVVARPGGVEIMSRNTTATA